MSSIDILGVRIDEVSEAQAVELVSAWMKEGEKRYIVTPNIEFVMAAQSDQAFKRVLNKADLAIPDSGRFNWVISELNEKNIGKKLLLWPLFLFPRSKLLQSFPVTAGTDLMHRLIEEAAKKGWSVGLLGGHEGVAEKLKEKLEKKYEGLRVSYADEGGVVDEEGEVLWINDEAPTSLKLRGASEKENDEDEDSNDVVNLKSEIRNSKSETKRNEFEIKDKKLDISNSGSVSKFERNNDGNFQVSPLRQSTSLKLRGSRGYAGQANFKFQIPPTDILFVAFGHGKQEKWMAKNLEEQPVKVMMGVGGAFDYLSGSVPRAPKRWQKYGFEWLYRLIQQPWRAKRFLSLIQFTFLVLSKHK